MEWWVNYSTEKRLYCNSCNKITPHSLRGRAVMGDKTLWLLYECKNCNSLKEVSFDELGRVFREQKRRNDN